VADRLTAAVRTQDAIRSAKSGEIGDARRLLREALTADREYPPAWLWFAAVTDDPDEQLFCLREANRLRPDATTARAIANLREATPRVPDELQAFSDPEPPELLASFRDNARQVRRRRRLVVAGLIVVLVLAAVVYGLSRPEFTPLYVAVVTDLDSTGSQGSGQEIADAAAWAADDANTARLIPDHRLELVFFDDNDDPGQAAEVAREIVEDGRYVAVIGHRSSAASEAASPVYAEAQIPAISPTATADALTRESRWYFRSVFDNSTQGAGAAHYGLGPLGGGSAAVVHSDTSFGRSLAQGFRAAYERSEKVAVSAAVDEDDAEQPLLGQVDAAVDKIEEARPTGPIFVATAEASAVKLTKEIRSRGLDNVIMGSDAVASEAFFAGLLEKPNPLKPEQFADIVVSTPLAVQALTGEAVAFYDAFGQQRRAIPSWESGLTYDAVNVIAQSLSRAERKLNRGVEDIRGAVRAEMDIARTPADAFDGLTQRIYFDSTGSAVRQTAQVTAGASGDGQVVLDSAPLQLVEYSPQAELDLEEALANGSAIEIDDTVFSVQRVVDVGLNFNDLTTLDVGTQSFQANFFVYLKYHGGDELADITFPNSVIPDLSPGEPVRKEVFPDASMFGDETYVLYQVTGSFRSRMDFTEFPFDEQTLNIVLGNETLPSSRVVYAPDPDLLLTAQNERLTSGLDATQTIDNITNWTADEVRFAPRAVGNTSSLGDPRRVASASGITYSQFAASVDVSRDTASFLVKNVLPLFLLAIVTFASLWIPFTEGIRITIATTGILTGAVMLGSVTRSLVNVEYTVAIEWAYYAFIALSVFMVVIALIGRRKQEKRRLASVRGLNNFARIFYALFVLGTVLAYTVAFG
jgi:ABC-type branched-subunit amino acid transport system substrate-binding protein